MICPGKNSIHKKLWPSLLILSAVTIAVYYVSFFYGFVWDDEFVIVKNPAIRQITSIANLPFSPDVVRPYYRPLTRTTYLFDYWLFGMNPSAFHVVNVVIHLLNVVLLYLVWIDPGHSDGLTQMGTFSATQGNFQKAEQYYVAALRSDPGNAMAHYNLGKLYEIKGNTRNTVGHFELALKYMTVTYEEYTEEIEKRVARLRASLVPVTPK
jgi:tetratricopeptide (TPR) repeat protein